MTNASPAPADADRKGSALPLGRGPITLALFAPLRNDDTLSRYSTLQQPLRHIEQHELVRSLRNVSAQGVHVVALIDSLIDAHSWLVEIAAGDPYGARVRDLGKAVRMDEPEALADLLRRAFAVDALAPVVLCMEGHGAGYLPHLNPIGLTQSDLADLDPLSPGGVVRWQPPNLAVGTSDRPILPMPHPPTGAAPAWQDNAGLLSTWAVGEGLKQGVQSTSACGRSIAVIHFNNCFNMSIELLSTVAPYAHYATGYMNYNFFTGGASYADVFARLRTLADADAADLARLFAEGNQAELAKIAGHPTTGGAVALRRLPGIVEAAYCLATALTQDAQSVAGRDEIQKAIAQAQQYDTGSGFDLDVPDQLTDLRSLAEALCGRSALSPRTLAAARDLSAALDGIKVYGDGKSEPLFLQGQVPAVAWDFEHAPLAMNVLLPDPTRIGLWDPRSPYYLLPPIAALPQVIDFLRPQAAKPNPWQEFIVEYHRGTPFAQYPYPRIVTPAFGAKPKRCRPCD